MLAHMGRYCGREWSTGDIARIRDLIAENPRASRARLSRLVCEAFEWRRLNGKLKDMSCRVTMLKMARDGLIDLPTPKNKPPSNYRAAPPSCGEAAEDLICSLDDLPGLEIQPVERGPRLRYWNELVGQHHYLGFKLIPGAQIRYLIMDGGRVLGAMGFGAAAWKVAPRDDFIGWTAGEREKGLHLIVGQSRFLILPWVHCRNLASKTLAMVTERLPGDWEARYGFKPALIETFVDTTRFDGGCYRASNWINVGNTKGRGKLDRLKKRDQPVKSIWVTPLTPRFREHLRGHRD